MQNKLIVVVGLGTVGRLVAELLIRSRMKRLIIVDEGSVEEDADLNE